MASTGGTRIWFGFDELEAILNEMPESIVVVDNLPLARAIGKIKEAIERGQSE